jgi:hypothetical protein
VLVGVSRVMFYTHFSFDYASCWQDEHVKSIVNQHIYYLSLLYYCILPPLMKKQFQIFDCVDVSEQRYVRSDTSVNCGSSQYLSFSRIIICFICLYQLIPVTWMYLLYRHRKDLNPMPSSRDKQLAMYIRDHNPNLAYIRFLFLDYKCNRWWFEIPDMYRRIMFIGIVPLISSDPSTRASFGCMLAIISVAYFREEQPYRVQLTNILAHIAQVYISE